MTDYRFTLISPGLPDLIIDQPVGFADIVQGMIRNEEWSGVYFQATINELGFYGKAMDYLEEQYATSGLKASVVFLAEQRCKDADPYEEVLRGRLNFGRRKAKCGVECRVTLPVEQEGCAVTFNNRYDQAVDIDSLVAFDRITALANYSAMGGVMTLAAQKLDVGVQGEVGSVTVDSFEAEMSPLASNAIYIWVQNFRPSYYNQQKNSIATGSLLPDSFSGIRQYNRDFATIYEDFFTPQLLFVDNIKCYAGAFSPEVTARLKGRVEVYSGRDDYKLVITVYFVKFTPSGDLAFPNWIEDTGLSNVLQKHIIYDQSTNNPANITRAFDFTYANPALTFSEGESFNAYVSVYAQVNDEPPENMTARVTFDPETMIDINTTRDCPPTDAQVYLVNETMSRVVEAITNNCIKVKSDYYGRTDSQPYFSGVDGCGSLRVLLNGLKLRQSPDNKMFLSMKDLYDGMIKAIDNCGMGFEKDPERPGYDLLRVEPIEYFYQDFEVLRFPFVPEVNSDTDESKHYSIIKVGYNKWEPRTVAGLDEFNANREFRTSLETVRTTLDITSNFIAAGYVIETTRQESFAATGAEDTTWDNDTFVICVDREIYGYKVEQGEIQAPTNMFSPATAYNFRITPLRNLMRHFKSIINSYANILYSSSKLFFSKGTGNYTATGQLIDDCADENAPKAENIDLSVTDFKNPIDSLPLVRNEIATWRYAFTASDWGKLRAKPNGYVSVQCGNGSWLKVYITDLQWEVRKGEAEIKGKIKWQ